ncbi:cyanoexosortase A system-associated protein [Phormidesmis priestleyi]
MQKKFRIGLLAATLGSALLVLGKTIVAPAQETRSMAAIRFAKESNTLPRKVSLSGWQFLASYPLIVNPQSPGLVSAVDEQTIAGRAYQYSRNGVLLTIEMRYFVNSYIHVPAAIKESSLAFRRPLLTIRQRPKGGFYVLFSQPGKTHLSACIPAYGESTVSDRQFIQNQSRVEVLSKRSLPWLLGQAALRDRRCLWATLSISSAVSPELLEDAWNTWYPLWRSHLIAE